MRRPNWIRWGVRGALTLGVAASIAANVLHAEPTIKARVISAWAPVALLVTIELIARVPTRRAWLVRGRLAAAGVVAGVAAWASYWHMAAVAARYGEEVITAHILPLSVDGLIVVASICLVELGGQGVAAATDHTPVAAAPDEDLECAVADALDVPHLPAIAAATRHLPAPPGRPTVKNTATDLDLDVSRPAADRIVRTLGGLPWPPEWLPESVPELTAGVDT